MKHSFRNSLMAILTLTSLIISAVGVSPVMAADPTIVSIDNLQPAWDAVGAGGVWSSYDAPPDYIFVSPGKTALYDGKEAGIIKAGLTVDPSDEGIFGFKPTLTIDELAAGPLTYDVENAEGTNPVWMTIEIDTGTVDDRSDNTTYQFVPSANPAGWNTFNAAAGDWQKWNNNDGDTTGNPLIPLSQVASENTGLNVVRAYLRLGMGPSYQGSGSGTIAWVDQVIIGTVTYDFVVDQTAPVVSVPTDMIEEAADASGAVVDFVVTAEDAVDGTLTPSCDPASGATFSLGETLVTCTATDAAGNPGNASFKITVQDTTVPDVNVPPDITAEAIDASGAVVSFTVTADDTVDGPLTASCIPASGDTFALGETTVTCTVTDAHTNIGSGSFKITIEDTTAPIIAVPADMNEEATSSSGAAVTFDVTASDLVDGSVTPICDANSGDTFPFGETTVNCEATDAAGNSGSASFKITVADTTAPDITVPANITAEATDASGAAVTFAAATAEDAVDGSLTPICDANSGDVFPFGETTVTCTVTDAANNNGSASFKITVSDTTAPVVTVPSDMTEEATSTSGVAVTFDVTASDNIDGSLAPSCDYNSGDTFPIGETTVTCTATDAASNPGNASFKIMVSVPAGQYDDTHGLWTYSAGWTAKTGTTGPIDGTFHMSSTRGNTATFKFQGPAKFVFTYRTGKNLGTFSILVDGVKIASINAYSATAVWQKTYTSRIYNDGLVHTVVIKNTSLTGAYLYVDAIKINAVLAPAGKGVYDDIDPLWVYSSGWVARTTASGPVDGTFHLTNTSGSKAIFKFQGPAQFVLTYQASKNRGTFDIYVDGVKVKSINAYSATTVWQKTYTSTNFDNKVHVVVIKNTSPTGTYIELDAIEIK